MTTWGTGNNTVSMRVSSTNGDTTPTEKKPGRGFILSTSGTATESGTVYFQYTDTLTASTAGYNVTKIIIQSK
jgi:hypothetical protein